MPRRVQDIVPGDRRRSIRDIEIESKKKAAEDDEPESRKNSRESEKGAHKISIHKSGTSSVRRMPVTPPASELHGHRNSKKKGKWLLLTLGAIVLIVAVAFIASTRYSRASFTIKPKSLPVTVNGTYVAQGSPSKGVLSYEVLTLKAVATTTVSATEGPKTSTKSHGTVTVYNAYSSSPVRLIAGSRLAGESGLVYRLTSSIVLPGYTKSSSGTVPGSIKTTITADQPGDEYNIGRTDSISDFKFLGYKGTARYDSVYARISGDISGGFLGTKKVVAPAALASTTAALKNSLTRTLLSKMNTAIPEGYMVFDGGYSLAFGQPSVDGGSKNSAVVTENGTIYGILIKKSDLISKLTSGKSETAFGKFEYSESGLDSLQLKFTNLKDFSPNKKTSLVFLAKGDFHLVGSIPVEEIRSKLQGSSLAKMQDLFRDQYKEVIETGTGELVPPWAKIPSDPERIRITVAQ